MTPGPPRAIKEASHGAKEKAKRAAAWYAEHDEALVSRANPPVVGSPANAKRQESCTPPWLSRVTVPKHETETLRFVSQGAAGRQPGDQPVVR